MNENALVIMAFTLVACALCQWVAWRVKLPAIIFLLLVGIVAGPLTGLLRPEALLGELLFPLVSLSVAVILFEGSLTLKFRDILGLETVVRNMVSFGMVITLLITAVAARYALDLSWQIAFLFGAITVVTGPTVIVPMLRTVRPTAAIANILRWEGIVIDPIGASLAVLVYEFIISGGGQKALGHTLLAFGQIVSVGTLVGLSGGYLFGLVLRQHWLPEFLHNVATLALVCGCFAVSDLLQPESGLVTVTIMGVWLANMKGVDTEQILDFKESLSILLISVLFIILAARLDIASLQALGWPAVIVLLVIQFLARPLNVMASAWGSKLSWPERHLLAWIAPRGIIAAAISALFAIQLEGAGFSDARILVPLTFAVIIGTVVLQSITARPIARWLKVAEPEPRGFLVIGANIVARSIATALADNGVRVLLADAGWDRISKARIAGLDAYLGNPISEHADRNLDLVGIGRLLALSPHESLNAAAVMRYRLEFSPNNTFALQSKPAESMPSRMRFSPNRRGKNLFGKDVTYAELATALLQEGEIRTTKLTEVFGYDRFLEQHQDQLVLLFGIDARENIHVFSADEPIEPGPGWSIIYLAPRQDERHDQPLEGAAE